MHAAHALRESRGSDSFIHLKRHKSSQDIKMQKILFEVCRKVKHTIFIILSYIIKSKNQFEDQLKYMIF